MTWVGRNLTGAEIEEVGRATFRCLVVVLCDIERKIKSTSKRERGNGNEWIFENGFLEYVERKDELSKSWSSQIAWMGRGWQG